VAEEEPVTVTISRKVKAGCEADYEAWASAVAKVAEKYPGNSGMTMLKPSPVTGGEYVMIVRFESYAHLMGWEQSEDRAHWLAKLDDIVEAESVHRVTGLEFLFALPEAPVGKPPSPHKMAIVLCVVVFSLVLSFNLLLGDWLSTLPLLARVAFVVIAQVLLMTYIIMPQVTKLLKPWLFGEKK